MNPVLVFRFARTEGPGHFATFLDANGIVWKLVRLDENEPVPASAEGCAGLGFMGGPMSANDELAWTQPVLEIDGKRETLEMGQDFYGAARQTSERPSVTLPADSRGQFYADGQVNGAHVRFVVDTGATTVLIPGPDADRLGLDYRNKGQMGHISTANGTATAYRVVLDSVTIGGITAYNVEAVVAEGSGLDVALLGMSFLNRTEMRRDGAYMTLTKRY